MSHSDQYRVGAQYYEEDNNLWPKMRILSLKNPHVKNILGKIHQNLMGK